MAASRSTSTAQLPAHARRRAEHLVELYEREAYRIYNLALRITCDEVAAVRATENAFLRHVASGSSGTDERAQLVKGTVTAALAEAPRQPDTTDDAESVSKATAALSPSQRAIIALLSLDETSEAVAAATGAPSHTAENLTARARVSLASELQIDIDFVDERLQTWIWAAPPEGIWERLYPKAHRLLAEREIAAAPTRAAKRSGSALAGRLFDRSPRARRRFGGGFDGRGGVWAFRAAVLAVILLPAAVVALADSGDKGSDNVALSAAGGAVPGTTGAGEDGERSEGGSTYDALTPKELDQLRLQELKELREYSQAQADKSLSQGQRSDAEARAQELLALARERLAEAEQAEQQAAAQQQKAKSPPPSSTAPPASGTTPTGTTPTGKKKKKKKKKGQTAPSDSISSCLFDPESGTYICPE